jgi:hypothetical protein
MAKSFSTDKQMTEGELMCKWFYRRMIKQNKNVLGANLGGTGTGKSYRDLRLAELWYDYQFKKPFPIENICFGTLDAMKRIRSGKLVRGELLMLEEAGANLGSLDFQNRASKFFVYILQSFRSMNIGILFNLPYLSMLNKSARMLMHYSMESKGIDYSTNKNKCILRFHQVNQVTGKIYRKKFRIGKRNRRKAINNISFGMPSPELVKAYEEKKSNYLNNQQTGFINELQKAEDKVTEKEKPKELSGNGKLVYPLLLEGKTQKEIASILKKYTSQISRIVTEIKKKGYIIPKKKEISRELIVIDSMIPPENLLT